VHHQKRVSESLVRRPPFARLSEEAKGAWRLTVARFNRTRLQRTPQIACLPAHDRPVEGRLESANSPRLSHVADARSAIVELRALGADPPRPFFRETLSRTKQGTGRATETVPISGCRRRPAGTGERMSVTCAISWLRAP